MHNKTADYVVNVGKDFQSLEPTLACFLKEEAIMKAWSYAQDRDTVAEVVYMPCDDINTNIIVYKTDGLEEAYFDEKEAKNVQTH